MMGGWNEIVQDGGSGLVDLFGDFKDSCVKEVRYVSGAYVDEELAMWPYNDKRTLFLLLQRQEEGPAAIELAFDGVECFHLEPAGEEYDCSIIRAEFYWREGMLWWSDAIGFDPGHPPYGQQFSWVCARSARWRIRDEWLGDRVLYGAGD